MSKSKFRRVALRVLVVAAASAVAIVLFAVPGALFRARQPSVPTHFKVDREIAATLRTGTDKSNVIAYCKSRGWETYNQGSDVIAIYRVVETFNIIRTDTIITFEFDREDKLVSFRSENHYTGP
jgi:hypothetical protein